MTKQNCFIACIIILVNTFNFVANYEIIEIKVSTKQNGVLMTSGQEKEQAKATLIVKTIFLLHPRIPSSSNTALPKWLTSHLIVIYLTVT